MPDGHIAVTTPWNALEDEYRSRTASSAAAQTAAAAALPGGETRSVAFWPPYPVAFADAAGSRLVDLDGNEYVDLVNNYTSLVHGNAFRPVADAVAELAYGPLAFAATSARQVALARELIERVPTVDLVRFTSSGSEANALALRLARRATGRRRAVVFRHSYHSALPLLVEGEPDVVVAQYNDPESLDAVIDDSIAAVFAEPFLGAGGVIPADPGFLTAVQQRAQRVGALFVLDEVQSLRTAHGGAQSAQDVTPDLTTMAKIIGGGFPIGAVGGRADLMRLTVEGTQERVSHAGTFNGHILACTAGLITLRNLGPATIAGLNHRGAVLAAGIERVASSAGVTASASAAGSILQVHPAQRPLPLDDQTPDQAAQTRALHMALLLEGIYTTPRGMVNLSTAIDDAELQRIIDGYGRAFARLAG